MDPTLTDWIQAIATVVTGFVAVAALLIARKAPEAAGRFADQYRAQSAKSEERERLKLWTFTMLLKGRRQMLHQDTIAALNLVDFILHDDSAVRSAYRLFVDETTTGDAENIINRYPPRPLVEVDVGNALAVSIAYPETGVVALYHPWEREAADLVWHVRQMHPTRDSGKRFVPRSFRERSACAPWRADR
jgi:hypothetical protein